MKGFKKLALVTAIAALPMSGFAMQALDDAAMSNVTGQDGLVVSINTGTLSMGINIHDKDGFAGHLDAGAIVIENMVVNTQGGDITLTIDAGHDIAGAGPAILNVAVSIPTGTTISTGDLSVAKSNGIVAGGFTDQSGVIMDSMDIVLGATTLNIQLGGEDQVVAGVGGGTVSQMIALNTSIAGGVVINNMALNDANSGGTIGATSITLVDTGGTDLTVVAGVNVTANGLEIGLGQIGDATNGVSVKIVDQYLGVNGTAPAIGDIEIVGLNLNGTTITVAGH